MHISELRSGMRSVTVEASVVSVSEPRTVNLRDGGTAKVADCIIKDDTGEIKLSLWEDHIAMVKAGSKISVENGYTGSFRGETNLNVGRYGKLKVIEY
jgi:replication factor A1